MDFYKRLNLVCSRIPHGRVATYGQLALLCGKPQNARQVGYALRCGLAGDDIPAHRVVNAKGILSGTCYFETWDMQKLLLQKEGIEVYQKDGQWAVDLKKSGWHNTLEDACDLLRKFEHEHI